MKLQSAGGCCLWAISITSALVLPLLALETGRSAVASEKSYPLIAQGVEALGNGRDEQALRLFDEAAAVDPKDAQAELFAGTALNQSGRYAEALRRLERAGALGDAGPELDFQTGRSLVGVGQWRRAIDRLNQFETARPGRGQTSEFLGRAHVGLGEYHLADEQFREALRRDPALASTVLPYQAALAQEHRDAQAAGDKLARLQEMAPESATAQEIRRGAAGGGPGGVTPPGAAPPAITTTSPAPAGQVEGGVVTLSLAVGYNSNARQTEVTSVLGSVPEKGSVFEELTLTASQTFACGADDSVTVGGDLVVDNYPQVDDADIFNPYLYAEYRHSFGPDLFAAVRASDGYELLGWDAFRNRVGVRAAVDWRTGPVLTLEAAGGWARNEYYFSTTPVLNPDSDTYTASVDAYVAVPDTLVRLRVGYFYSWTNARGADFDSRSGGVIAGASIPLPWDVTAAVSYLYTLEGYENLNSLTADPVDPFHSLTYRRRDRIHALSVRLSRPLDQRTTVYVGYDYNRDLSNLRAYDYEQNVFSAGVTWQF